jgi:hypothetical protein
MSISTPCNPGAELPGKSVQTDFALIFGRGCSKIAVDFIEKTEITGIILEK